MHYRNKRAITAHEAQSVQIRFEDVSHVDINVIKDECVAESLFKR
jgi:hypothetical protein